MYEISQNILFLIEKHNLEAQIFKYFYCLIQLNRLLSAYHKFWMRLLKKSTRGLIGPYWFEFSSSYF
jgi:hypothetical protein